MSNPQEQGPQPPFPEQRQQWPGVESEMQPKPDFGESSYRGHERLKGKAAIVTGGDSGIGRAVALAYAREVPTCSSPTSASTRMRNKRLT
jgi:hypothetical protein